MTQSPANLWAALSFAIATLLALVAGVMLATPNSTIPVAVIGLIAAVLVLPVLLRSHRLVLFWSWNAGLLVFFLPGAPHLWMILAGVSLLLTVLGNAIERGVRLQSVPAVTWTLLLFLLVMLITAAFRGGIGIKALGGRTFGGRRYIFIIAAVVGYFALSLVRVPAERAFRHVAGWCLGSLTIAMSNFIYIIGPAAYWLFAIFPVEFALEQASADFAGGSIRRFNGIGIAMMGPYCLMLIAYGIRGLLNLRSPLRLLLFFGITAVSLLGGFRSLIAFYGMLFLFQFTIEGLWRTRHAVALVVAVLLGATAMIPFARYMPLTIQRSVSFLPLDIAPQAQIDAQSSSDWRFQMWRLLWSQAPKYLLLGKGYALDPMDLYVAQESQRRGFTESYETAMIAGDFHSGPLSLLIGFGLPGTLAFAAFLFASWKVVRHHYRHGAPELRRINTFLYAYFLCRITFFVTVFGDIGSDFSNFTGIIGVSIALNGVPRARAPATPVAPAPTPQPQAA